MFHKMIKPIFHSFSSFENCKNVFSRKLCRQVSNDLHDVQAMQILCETLNKKF